MKELLKRIESQLKNVSYKILEALWSKKEISPENFDREKIRQILIVRPHDQLGDFVLSTPAIQAVIDAFPKAKVTIVVKEYFVDVVKENPDLQVLVFYQKLKNWNVKRALAFWKQLRKGYDLAIVFNTASHSFTSDLVAVLSGAKYILGSDVCPFTGTTRNFFYNLIAPTAHLDVHITYKNLAILEYIGISSKSVNEIMHLNCEHLAALRQEFSGIYQNEKLTVGMHIGANKFENRWQIEKFADLAEKLSREYKAQIMVFWGPKEWELKEAFEKYNLKSCKLVPPSSLYRQAMHFSLCDFVLCNDTGVMHLCAAVGTPLIAIFGPTNPKFWKPLGEQFIAVRAEDHITGSVTVEQVYSEFKKMLKSV